MLTLLNLLFITAFTTSWKRNSLIRETLISPRGPNRKKQISASKYSD
uniref:Uncharacterized protein n=1 Tax=Setaria viridis TaxID=4556 RepID=A0A4U6VRQ1_SETVI|nr:hypothetical protein SEVIR_2G171333v2 [Setaria viridis]